MQSLVLPNDSPRNVAVLYPAELSELLGEAY